MAAFEQFTDDLQLCHRALRLLQMTLETELHIDARKARTRQDALARLPRLGRKAESNYSINGAALMVGKTVDKVECGFRHDIEGVHQSELLIIHFTDGSVTVELNDTATAGCRQNRTSGLRQRPTLMPEEVTMI